MVDKLARMLGKGPKGPKEPTKFMSAKNYRDNIVVGFLKRVFEKIKDIIETARSCFVELAKVQEERDLYKENYEYMEKDRDQQREKAARLDKRNDELLESEKQLGYFKEYISSDLYNQVIEKGEMNEKIISRGGRSR
jgi:uncharacterized protein (UPF0305 family)